MKIKEIKKEMAVFEKALKLAIENQGDRSTQTDNLIAALEKEIENYKAWVEAEEIEEDHRNA